MVQSLFTNTRERSSSRVRSVAYFMASTAVWLLFTFMCTQGWIIIIITVYMYAHSIIITHEQQSQLHMYFNLTLFEHTILYKEHLKKSSLQAQKLRLAKAVLCGSPHYSRSGRKTEYQSQGAKQKPHMRPYIGTENAQGDYFFLFSSLWVHYVWLFVYPELLHKKAGLVSLPVIGWSYAHKTRY